MALYFSPFLNTGVTCASFQASGVLSCFSDARYNLETTGATMSASSFRAMGLRLSGPAALCAFNPFSLLRTPSSVMLIGGICGVSFGVPSGLMKFVALVHSAFREREGYRQRRLIGIACLRCWLFQRDHRPSYHPF